MDMVADVGRRRRRLGWGRPGVHSVRDGVLLVVSHLEVAVFLRSCSDKFCSLVQIQFFDVGVVLQLQFIDRVSSSSL